MASDVQTTERVVGGGVGTCNVWDILQRYLSKAAVVAFCQIRHAVYVANWIFCVLDLIIIGYSEWFGYRLKDDFK